MLILDQYCLIYFGLFRVFFLKKVKEHHTKFDYKKSSSFSKIQKHLNTSTNFNEESKLVLRL